MCPFQARTDEGFRTLFESHVKEYNSNNLVQILNEGGSDGPLPAQGQEAAEVNCALCLKRFEVPFHAVVDVTSAKMTSVMRGEVREQLWCCGECARNKSCWGEVWGLRDGEGPSGLIRC
jgi:hypothetical protein